MTTGTTSQFSAADSALGYLYQVRSALLWSLRRQKSDSEFLVSLETLDDVTFETIGGTTTDLLQTKHHLKKKSTLTDACPDLWKTLRVWFEGSASKIIPRTARLFLVTTGTASVGSAAAYLKAQQRDVEAAQRNLEATASSSENETNATAYGAFLAATLSDRIAILDRVTVIDASPCVIGLDAELRSEVYWAANRNHLSPFLERLEGWWFRRVLRQLTDTSYTGIGSVELEGVMADLREQFKQDALPIDGDILDFDLDEETRFSHQNYVFVKQLELVKVAKQRIAAAIRDYYRAFTQRSRWLRDDLVADMDLHKYERRLAEEWEHVFAAMCDECGEDATEEVKEQAARSVLAWAERSLIPIRPNVTEPFVTRGSLHMLSDKMAIGWHPEFRERLRVVLSNVEPAA